jgi:hypothetical protein
MPVTQSQVPCPVAGCPYASTTRDGMKSHFVHRHPWNKLTLLEEPFLEQCPACGRLLYHVNDAHRASACCKKLALRRQQVETAIRRYGIAKSVHFHIGETPIQFVDSFRYLGRMVAHDDNDDLAIRTRIQAALGQWNRLRPILTKDGVRARTAGRIYLVVVLQCLLHGSDTWVLEHRSQKRLDAFHNCCLRHMAGNHIRRLPDGTWIYPPTASVQDACGLSDIHSYIAKRRTGLLNRYARPHSPMYSHCISSPPPSGILNHHATWWQVVNSDID